MLLLSEVAMYASMVVVIDFAGTLEVSGEVSGEAVNGLLME